MSLKRCVLRAALWFTLATAPVCFGASIDSFSPVAGSPGDPNFVFIYGTGFSPGSLVVTFNGTRDFSATATAADGTVIQASVPPGATTGPITVQVNGGTVASSLDDFVVIGPGPYVSGFSPAKAGEGATITFTGAHLLSVTNVSFSGKTGTIQAPVSDTTLKVTTPPGVLSGPITLRNPGGLFTTSSNFYAPPSIRNYSPVTGRTGTNVIVMGTNFLDATAVRFGGVFATTFSVLSNGAIQATIPTNAVTGIIRVDAPAGSAQTSGSNFLVQPTIFGFSPLFGSTGTNVLITGANFTNATTPVPTVKFGGVTAGIPTGIQFGQLNVAVPPGATSAPISVVTSDGTAVSPNLFYVPASITSFTPTNSPPGSTVKITGINFTNASAVTFGGGAAANFVVTNNTIIGAIVPTNASTGPISITTPAGTINSSGLFYVRPGIISFSPTNGLPGTNVTITGSNFLGATSVTFNGTPATFFVTNNTTIGAFVPNGATTGPITVIAPAGTNTSDTSFVVTYISDLTVQVTDTPDPVFVTSNLVYSITIVNQGPFAAANVMLTNVLPASVTLLNTTVSQGTWQANGNTVVASLGTIVNSASALVTFTVRPQATGAITNISIAVSESQDPNLVNSTLSTITTVLPLPLLSIRAVPIDKVRVSWPVELTNFLLQSQLSLGTNTWSNVLTAPVIVGNENVVTETNTGPSKFYRLRK
jgi:hypothetical protein